MSTALTELGMAGLVLWGGALVAILLGLFFWLRSERRSFSKQDKTGSWLWLRVCYLPILLITAVAIVLPIRAVSGMEALGYFYLALFTAGPLVWFGLHVLIGKMLHPAFTRSESLMLALSGLGFIIVPAVLISTLQGPIFATALLVERQLIGTSPSAPLPFEVQAIKRFDLGGGDLHTQSLIAPATVKIQRIYVFIGGNWHDTSSSMHSYYCRNGEDIHLAWAPDSPIYPLRFHWQDAEGNRYQSMYQAPVASDVAVEPFELSWRDDGFDLPVPLHRDVIWLNWHANAANDNSNDNSNDNYSSLNPLQAGENFSNDCVMKGYQRVNWLAEGPVMKVMLIVHGNSTETSLRHILSRPDSMAPTLNSDP